MVGLGLLQTLLTGTFSGVWLALIGWFLISAATAEEQQARMGGRLSGVRVADVMTRDPVVADGTMTLADFVDRLAMSRQFLVPRGPRRSPDRAGDAEPGAGGALRSPAW